MSATTSVFGCTVWNLTFVDVAGNPDQLTGCQSGVPTPRLASSRNLAIITMVALAPRYKEALNLSRRLNAAIAGPDATDERRLRGAAALEVLGVALLTSCWLADIDDEIVRKRLLDAAVRVLQ